MSNIKKSSSSLIGVYAFVAALALPVVSFAADEASPAPAAGAEASSAGNPPAAAGDASAQQNVQAIHSKAEIDAAAELDKLNAANASASAQAPDAYVNAIAGYEDKMKAALAMSDATQREAAITAARKELAESTNKTITASGIGTIDNVLGIVGAPANLGTSS